MSEAENRIAFCYMVFCNLNKQENALFVICQ